MAYSVRKDSARAAARRQASLGPLGRVSVSLAAGSVVLFASSVAHACSGPGAQALVARNEGLRFILFFMGLALLPVSWIARRWSGAGRKWLYMHVGLLLIHPGWWMSAASGDCGYTTIEGSLAVDAILLLGLSAALWISWRKRTRTATR